MTVRAVRLLCRTLLTHPTAAKAVGWTDPVAEANEVLAKQPESIKGVRVCWCVRVLEWALHMSTVRVPCPLLRRNATRLRRACRAA